MSQADAGHAGPTTDSPPDWDAFEAAVRSAFFRVKRALAERRAEVCRSVMTDDAWEHVRAQVEVLEHDGCVNLQDGIDISEVRPADHDVDADVERLTVRLMVSGTDCVVDQATRKVVSGQRQRDDWLEEWTFERHRDQRSRDEAAAPRCPNCGAPLSVDSDGACVFCHAPAPGARADWLVAAIGRPPEASLDPATDVRAQVEASKVVVDAMAAEAAEHPWTGRDPVAPGMAAGVDGALAAIKARDPDFNAPDLVVEARELFLKLEDARNELRPEMMRPVLADDLYTDEVRRAERVAASGRNEVRAFLDIAGVSLVDASAADGGRDRLVVRVSATSGRSVLDVATGALVEGSAVPHPWAEDLVFERASTALTNPLTGLLGHRCPACGQPEGVTDDGRCVYCGEHVTGGDKDWILVAVRPVTDVPRPAAPAAQP